MGLWAILWEAGWLALCEARKKLELGKHLREN